MIRLSIVVLALVLGGCGSGGKTDERDAAAGKILPGSASDAMLQTDRLQSEAPLAAPKVASEEGDQAADKPIVKAGTAAEKPMVAGTPEKEAAATPPAAAPAPVSATPPAP